MHDVVDLRSDTLTLPTPEMREAIARADVGDDVWEEDPTVKRLEAMAADRLGKQAGLLVTSGTQGNLVSVVAQSRAGQEIVLDADSHVFNYEVGGAAVVGNVQTRPIKTARGFLTPAEGIAKLPSLRVDLASVQTNIVIFHVERPGGPAASARATQDLVAGCAARKVKVHAIGAASIRCVTHKDVDTDDIARALEAMREITQDWA